MQNPTSDDIVNQIKFGYVPKPISAAALKKHQVGAEGSNFHNLMDLVFFDCNPKKVRTAGMGSWVGAALGLAETTCFYILY